MLSITAVNEESRGSATKRPRTTVEVNTTTEAQESEAISLYNKALHHKQHGDIEQAQQTFRRLLDSTFLQKVAEPSPSPRQNEMIQSHTLLHYSVLKNLAELAEKENDINRALEYYMEAVSVDSSDVLVWFTIGQLATNISNYSLARHAFETGLEINANHWPCLDHVITVLYALNNYEACLYYIGKALEKDPTYVKGVVFKEKILADCPYLQTLAIDFFQNCDCSVDCGEISEQQTQQYIDEALAMRHKKQELAHRPDRVLPPSLLYPMPLPTWKCLGESLVAIYRHISTAIVSQASCPYSISYCSQVDLSRLLRADDVVEPVMSSVSLVTSRVSLVTPDTVSQLVTSTLPTSTLPVAAYPSAEFAAHTALKRGRKRKNFDEASMQFATDSAKRRSTRMRSTVIRPREEAIDYQETLRAFLPPTLRFDGVESVDAMERMPSSSDGVMNTRVACGSVAAAEAASQSSCPVLINESEDVRRFLTSHAVNGGVVNVLTAYLTELSQRCHMTWPDGLAEVYLKAYRKLRKHITLPSYLSNDSPADWMRNIAMICLVQLEITLDRWRQSHAGHLTSANSPRRSPAASAVTADSLGQHFSSDLQYILSASFYDEILGSDLWPEFCARVNWLHAGVDVIQSDLQAAEYHFNEACEVLSSMERDGADPVSVWLPNCATDNCISQASVRQQLKSLRQCQSLDEVYRLADSGEHDRVIDLLLPLFDVDKLFDKSGASDRYARSLLLIDSFLSLKNFEKAFLYGELLLNEMWRKYVGGNYTSKNELTETLMDLFSRLQRCIQADESILSTVSPSVPIRLANNLIEVVAMLIDVGDYATEMKIPSIAPWILLFSVIHLAEKLPSDSSSDNDSLPPSLSFLVLAHEQLGRRGRCMMDEGRLLQFSVDILYSELLKQTSAEDTHRCKDEIDAALEQCFYCLYGHPNKRAKAKHLEDHSANPILLTWDKCQVVFDFFKPKTLPEYDSYKTSAVSAELENLLRRISLLIPERADNRTSDQLYEYIQGSSSTPPQCSDITVTHPALVTEIYYLLADYYFKNKEMTKAIKHYVLDLCVCPERFDSWAGMALARHSRLENKLSAHELKLDVPIQKHVVSTLRCFERALQLDDASGKLWIEYGSCAYLIHSHTSRLLKQQESFSTLPPVLSRELLQQATTNYSEMLHVAKNCFTMAASVTSTEEIEPGGYSEEWLLHYMLGKIAEKLRRPPNEYLDHYQKASENLHRVKAKYPKKIAFYNVPYLAIESLEVYYRIHASVIKFLLNHEVLKDSIPFESLEALISRAASQPFVSCVEKEKDRRTEKRSDVPDCELESFNETPSEKSYHTRDHTYFYDKLSLLSATSEAMAMNYWPVPSCPASERRTYFHPMLSSAAAISLSPQTACRTSETPSYFVRSPLMATHITMSPIASAAELPALTSSPIGRGAVGVCHPGRRYSLTDLNVSCEAALDLTVGMSRDLHNVHISLSEEILSRQAGDMSSTSRTSRSSTSAINAVYSGDVPLCVGNSSSYVPSPINRSFNSEPTQAVVNTVQLSETGVTVPASCNDDAMVDREMPNKGLNVSTVENTGSSVLQTFLVAADTPPLTLDASVSQHHTTVVPVTDQYSASAALLVSYANSQSSSANVEPDLTAAVSDQDIVSNLMSVMVSKVAEESLQLPATELSLRDVTSPPTGVNCQEIDHASVASSGYPGTSTSDAVAQYPQPSEISELSQHESSSNVVMAASSATDAVHSSVLSTAVQSRDENFDILPSGSEADVGLAKMEVDANSSIEQPVLGSAGVESSLAKDNQLLSASTELGGEVSSDGIVDFSRVLDPVVQSSSLLDQPPTRHTVFERERTVAGENTEHHSTPLNTSLECSTEVLSSDLNAAKCDSLTEEGTDVKPVLGRTNQNTDAAVSDNADACKPSLNGADSDGRAVDVEVTGGTSVLAVNTLTNTTSDEEVSESKLNGTSLEPNSATVAVEVNVPAANALQQDTPVMPSESNADNGAASTAAEETDRNQRFKELMMKCTKALELCLTRFPQHYKSLYRLADVFFRCSCLKDLQKCRDILLGSSSGQQTDLNLPCPGMFQERKQSNFFQGLWRIPSQEVDRAGSFAAHLSQALILLLNVLKATHDAKMLFFVHRQLATSPPNDRKYLRDVDRIQLSQLALINCLDALEEKMQEQSVTAETGSDEDDKLYRLLLTYQVRQFAAKMQAAHLHRADKLLMSAYRTYIDVELKELPALDDIAQFCSRLQTLKPAQEKSVHGGHSLRTHSPPPITVTISQTAVRHPSGSAAELGRYSTSSGTSIITSFESVTSTTHNAIQPRKLEQRSEARPSESVKTVTARTPESSAGLKRSAVENFTPRSSDRSVAEVDSAADYGDTSTGAEQLDSPPARSSRLQSDISSVDDDDDDDDDVIVISSSSPDEDDDMRVINEYHES